MMLTIAQTIVVGKISSPLAANYNSLKSFFGGPALAAIKSPMTIRMAADALQWAVDGDNLTDAELRSIANYIKWLCGKFALQAENMIGVGGSVTTIVPGALRPGRIDFTVSASSYFPTGSTGGSISDFVGYNLDFIRGGLSQSTEVTEPTYFSWNRATAVFACYPALAEGEVIALIPS